MPARFFSIVCAVDLSERSPVVIEHALSEAHRHRNISLHFITVVEPPRGRFARVEPAAADLEVADQKLRALVRESLPGFVDDMEDTQRRLRFHTRAGVADEEILELAMEARTDRIVVGCHSSEHRRKLLGGISGAIVNAATCTVEVVRVADYGPVEDDYEQCPLCVETREQSGGERWFCSEHSEGRIPRLTGSVGISSPTPGWGIF